MKIISIILLTVAAVAALPFSITPGEIFACQFGNDCDFEENFAEPKPVTSPGCDPVLGCPISKQ